jgi:hypothetical protein
MRRIEFRISHVRRSVIGIAAWKIDVWKCDDGLQKLDNGIWKFAVLLQKLDGGVQKLVRALPNLAIHLPE